LTAAVIRTIGTVTARNASRVPNLPRTVGATAMMAMRMNKNPLAKVATSVVTAGARTNRSLSTR
jgi:hypothetical protein